MAWSCTKPGARALEAERRCAERGIIRRKSEVFRRVHRFPTAAIHATNQSMFDRRPPNDPAEQAKAAASQLGVAVEQALLRELNAAYHDLNHAFFGGSLLPAAIELSSATSRLGRWNPAHRTLEVSRELAVNQPWGQVIEVLKHEMAHQYVQEVLGQTSEPAHGPVFRMVCERLGIDARAAGPVTATTADPDETKLLQRIAKLLALAESANLNEAQAAMNAAQRLMLRYNIDESQAVGSRRRDYHFRHLGKPSGRISEAERVASVLLGEHFFVEVIWVPTYMAREAKRGSVLEVCGTEANVEMAAYVYDFLLGSAESLWLEHKRQYGIRGNRDRRTFLAGVMCGFREKLKAQQRQHQQQGLVWSGDPELKSFYRKRHPHIRLTRYAGQPRNDAHESGRRAGRELVLHRPLESGPSASGPKALPGRR